MDMHITPLLAIDFGNIVFFLFLLVSFFGWISKLLKKAGGEQQGGGKGPIQGEINDFLKEVLGEDTSPKRQQRPARPPQPRRDQQEERRQFDESSASTEASRRPPQQRKPRPQRRRRPPVQRPSDRQSTETAKPLFEEESRPSRQKVKDRHVQSSVGSHVENYMHSDVKDHRLPSNLTDHERGNLAKSSDITTEVLEDSSIAEQMVTLLSSPEGMKQVILAHEILSKPRSLR